MKNESESFALFVGVDVSMSKLDIYVRDSKKSAEEQKTASLVVRRKQLVELIGQEQNRLKQCRDPKIRKLIEKSQVLLEVLGRHGVDGTPSPCLQNPRGLGTGPQGCWYQFRF